MSIEIRISDKCVLSDNDGIRGVNNSSTKQNDYTAIKMEHITKKALNDASQRLQLEAESLQKRMNQKSPVEIIRILSNQQKQYKLAIEKLKPFINGEKRFSPDDLDAIKRSTEIKNNAKECKANCHIADALLKDIEKNNLDKWKQRFDAYKQDVDWFNKTYALGKQEYERGQKGTLSFDSIQRYNCLAKKFNKMLEGYTEDHAKRLASLNVELPKYNATRPDETALQELQLPKEELKSLNRANSKSRFSFSKMDLMHGLGKVGLMGLGLTQVVEPAYALPINALAEANGNSFLKEPMYQDHRMNPLQDSYKDVSRKHMTEAPSLDTSLTPRGLEYPGLVRRDFCNSPGVHESLELLLDTANATVYAIGNEDEDVRNAARAVAQTIEADNAYLADTFGVKPDGLPFIVYVTSDIGRGPDISGAYHCRPEDTALYISSTEGAQVSAGYTAVEMTEVYETALNKHQNCDLPNGQPKFDCQPINNGWIANATNGEVLSRALGTELHPELGSIHADDEADWWNHGAHDYISTNEANDRNHEGNGCGTLFMYYLHYKLGKSWKEIVHAGGNTLAETYSILTGNRPDTAFLNFKKDLQPFIIAGKLVLPDNGNPWDSAAEKKALQKRKWIIGGTTGGGGVLLLGGAAAAYYIWRRKRQETRMDPNSLD